MELCEKYNRNFDEVKRWYDGYQLGYYHVYNPNAVLSMLAGDSVRVRTKSFQNDMANFKGKDDVLTLLVHLGYLAYDQKNQTAYIPNEEIRSEFAEAVEENR